jgi:lipopolysaccharide export system permease protein
VTILQRYILRELSAPVVLSILFFTFLLLLGQLLRMAEDLLRAKVGWAMTLELLGIVTVTLFVLTIPMAVLLGTIMGIGRMTSENEILAIRMGGVSLIRVFWPFFLVATVATGILLWANWTLVPSLLQRLTDRKVDLIFRTMTTLEPGRNYENLAPRGSEISLYFNERGERQMGDGEYHLRMKKVAMRVVGEADRLTGARVTGSGPQWDEETYQAPRETVFFASEGLIEGKAEDRTVTIVLNDGIISPVNRLVIDRATNMPIDRSSRRRETIIEFDRMTQTINPRIDATDVRRIDPRALRSEQLLELTRVAPEGPIREVGSRNRISENWQVYLNARNELYQRISLPLSLLAFALIAVPLAVELRPRARTMSFLVAILVILVYYGLNTFANAVGMTNSSFTFLLFLLPNVLIGGTGIYLFWRH